MQGKQDKFLRQLIPKSYHFDGYNEVNCPNSRAAPFFSNNIVELGNRNLVIKLIDRNTISLEFESICVEGYINFKPYKLSIEKYVAMLKEAVQNGCDFITIPIVVDYQCSSLEILKKNECKVVCGWKNDDCMVFLKKNRPTVLAAVSFDMNDVKEALAKYYGISNQNDNKMGGTNMKMKKSLFGMNFEFGVSKDANIASTLLGVAVKNPATNNWYTYDGATNSRKNLVNIKFGNFKVFLLPVAKLEVGDLIKKDGSYFYVKAVNPDGTYKLLNAADGMVHDWVSDQNFVFNTTFYTKVVALDPNTLMNGSKENMGNNVLAAIFMMSWANGGSKEEFSLDSISDDAFNGLGSYLPLLITTNGGNFGSIFTGPDGKPNLAMMMMLGSDGESDMDSMMQMLLLQQLMGGGINNALSSQQTEGSGNTAILNQLNGLLSGVAPASSEDKVKCEKCGQEYKADAKFCSKCGGKTKPLFDTCNKCGAALKPDAKFCHKCGASTAPSVVCMCGHAFRDGEAFCPNCGKPCAVANEPIKCPKCGRDFQKGEAFCPQCGTGFYDSSVPASRAIHWADSTPAVQVGNEAPAVSTPTTLAVPVEPENPAPAGT